MGTRIQDKSRGTKRPMVDYQYDLNGAVLTTTRVNARKPKLDKKGYPDAPTGIPAPVLVAVAVVDTTP